MLRLTRTARVAAAVGGLLWTVKALVITVRDGSFEPLEGVAWIGGLLGIVTAAVLYAAVLSGRYHGIARLATAAGAAIGLIALSIAVSAIGWLVVRGIAPGDNAGLEEEGGILVVGLVWLAVAVAQPRRAALAPARV